MGFTGYYYSDGWDNAYEEINLSFGYGFVTLDYADGTYKAPVETKYSVTSLTIETPVGLYITAGSFGKDNSGDWTEIGYGVELDSGVGMSVALISSDNLGVGFSLEFSDRRFSWLPMRLATFKVVFEV